MARHKIQSTPGLLDSDAIDAVTVPGRRELPPLGSVGYRAFFDPSGGRRDAAALAIGHKEKDTAVIDVLRSWPSPHNPSGVIEEACSLLKSYRLGRVVGDRFGGELPREQFRARGIGYDVSPADRSTLYLAFLGIVNSGRVLLPDDKELQRELRMLERKRGPSGKDRVDHPVGGADDKGNVAAGVSFLLTQRNIREPGDLGVFLGGRTNFLTGNDPALEALREHDEASKQPPSPWFGTETCGGTRIEEHAQRGCSRCAHRVAQAKAKVSA